MSRPQDPVPGQPVPPEPQDPAPTRHWFVLVEETTGSGDSMRWSLSTIRSFRHYREAQESARELARTYQPRHPASPRRRRTFRVGEDCWVVHIEGMTRTFHFRVSVAEEEDF
jgi:hypothetical protein